MRRIIPVEALGHYWPLLVDRLSGQVRPHLWVKQSRCASAPEVNSDPQRSFKHDVWCSAVEPQNCRWQDRESEAFAESALPLSQSKRLLT